MSPQSSIPRTFLQRYLRFVRHAFLVRSSRSLDRGSTHSRFSHTSTRRFSARVVRNETPLGVTGSRHSTDFADMVLNLHFLCFFFSVALRSCSATTSGSTRLSFQAITSSISFESTDPSGLRRPIPSLLQAGMTRGSTNFCPKKASKP